MSTELCIFSAPWGQTVATRYWGGDELGRMIQLTGPHGYVQLSADDLAKVLDLYYSKPSD
jgi:hypothetical protein